MVQTDLGSIARRFGYSPYEPRTRFALGVELRQMLDVLGASPDCRAAPAACVTAGKVPSRIEQNPTAMLLRADAHLEYRPDPLLALVIDLGGQYTRDALPAFEEISGGSFSAGRGYDPAAITGDTGLTSRFEVRVGSLVPDTVDSFSLQPFVFADAAMVRDRDPSQRALNPDGLASIGAGLRFAHGAGMQGDVSLAVPLTRTDAQQLGNQPRGDVRLLASLTTRLLPWRF